MEELERAAMDMLLAGDDPELDVLRSQYASAKVIERSMDSAGFFSHFSVPADCPRLSRDFEITDVIAEVAGMQQPVGFVLFIRDGAVDMLDCWIIDDDWPQGGPMLNRAYYVHRPAPGSPSVVETPHRDLGFALRERA